MQASQSAPHEHSDHSLRFDARNDINHILKRHVFDLADIIHEFYHPGSDNSLKVAGLFYDPVSKSDPSLGWGRLWIYSTDVDEVVYTINILRCIITDKANNASHSAPAWLIPMIQFIAQWASSDLLRMHQAEETLKAKVEALSQRVQGL